MSLDDLQKKFKIRIQFPSRTDCCKIIASENLLHPYGNVIVEVNEFRLQGLTKFNQLQILTNETIATIRSIPEENWKVEKASIALEKKRARERVANMSAEQIARKRSKKQVANMSDKRIEATRSSHQVANMSEERIEVARSSHQVANMSDRRIEAARSSHQVANMSKERIEAQSSRSSRQVANMSEEQKVAIQSSRRVANMSEAQRNTRQRTVLTRLHQSSLEQEWDFAHPCEHCGKVWLKSCTKGERK